MKEEILQILDSSIKTAMEHSTKSIQNNLLELKKEMLEEIKKSHTVTPSRVSSPNIFLKRPQTTANSTDAEAMRKFIMEHLKDTSIEKLNEIVAIMKQLK